MMLKKILLLCSASLMLISCGGGYNSNAGGGGGSGGGGGAGGGGGNAIAGVDGVYSGIASSNGYTYWIIILPNEQLYGVYGRVNGNQILLDGMITGQGSLNSSVYTASLTDISYTGSVKSGTFSASDFTGAGLSGTLTEDGSVTTFTANSLDGSVWDYPNFQWPASLSSISGTWTGTLLDGMTTTATISPTGGVTGSSSGCSFTGTAVPDSSQTSFFDVSLTFGSSPCGFPNQTANGIGVEYVLSDGVTNQLLVVVTVGNSAGTVFAAESQ